MNDKFKNLTEEKQNKIIKAALDEFSEKGYDKSSTDIIAQNSEIAKGSLFYYFKSKKNLYLYIVEYCLDLITEKLINDMNKINKGDFYERIMEVGWTKQRLLIEYPLHSKIILDAFLNMPIELKENLDNLYIKNYTSNMQILQKYILDYMDLELLKPTVKKEDAIFITMSLFEAFSKKYTEMYKNRVEDLLNNKEQFFKEFDKYVDIIKYGIYK
ncbi:transcriptional regulator, TetR family [Clostridium cavendishii DSM 21758]|uniref:Transcriptional regulator, TetR family n=1 Tax=Clostridium cavendishii DSM 21758 TaxID=1121302 RepID=A0A1M6IXI4_9CLOT|nr:TetR/AcrR family transcriptional regulator [Clostridium cavendishii]SHJ39127.1 transcriptional regulator, TetR family [Clostridium cavendishii DSM 21758]